MQANYKGSDFIGKSRARGELRARAARDDRLGAGRDRRGRTRRSARSRPPRRPRATTSRSRSTSGCRRSPSSAFGKFRGALVAIEPATGGVLALVSKPGYDPNLFVDGIDAAALGGAQQRPRQAAQQPRAHRRLSARLDVQAVHGDDGARARASARPSTRSATPGSSRCRRGHRWRDWKVGGHGTVNLHQSIVISCDTYYYGLANDIDIDAAARLSHAVRVRAADRRSTSTASSGGLLPSREWKRKRFKRPEEQKWYRGRQRLGRHRPGLQPRHAAAARVRDRDPRQQRRRLPAARRAPRDRRAHRRDAARSSRSRCARCKLQPEVGRARAGARWSTSRKPGGTARALGGGRRVHLRRQDRHRAGDRDEAEREVRREEGRRAAPRPRAVRRLRAGRERRRSRSGSWSRTAATAARTAAPIARIGARLLPPRQGAREVARTSIADAPED